MSRTSRGLPLKDPFLAERRAAGLAFALWHLVAVALLAATRDPRVLAAFGVSALAGMSWRARKNWTESGALGWANGVTWGRILTVAALLVLPLPAIAQAGVAFAVFALDGVDGAIARRRGTASEFGAALDKESDAFFVLAIVCLLWLQGVAGPWVLVAGLWRYGYGLAVAWAPGMRAAPRSNWARYSYSSACVCLVLALASPSLFPQWGLSLVFAALANFVISASFLRSLYYSFARS